MLLIEMENLLNTDKLFPPEVLLIPSLKDFEGGEFRSGISYKDIIENDELNNEQKQAKLTYRFEFKFLISTDEYYNHDIYLNEHSNIVVIDFDNIEETKKKIKFLRGCNSSFDHYWGKFETDYLAKTFKVKTGSGGEHYYFRRNKGNVRKTKVIKPTDYLTKDQLTEFNKKFSSEILIETKKKDEENPVPMIDLDYISHGLVIGPGNVIKNLQKKGKLHKVRKYVIEQDYPLIEIANNEDNELFEYLFRIDFENEKKNKKVRKLTEKAKGQSVDPIRYDFTHLIQKIKFLENVTLDTDSLELKDISEILFNKKEEIRKIQEQLREEETKINSNSFIVNALKQQIEFETGNFEHVLIDEAIKREFRENYITEGIYNILQRYNLLKRYFGRESSLYPLNFSKISSASVGERSEIEMAFILNLKMRNFHDSFIYFLIQRDFPANSKSLQNQDFIEQAIIVAEDLRRHPELINRKGIWNDILVSLCLVRKINFEAIFPGKNKMRGFVETLYDQASINNSLTIKTSQKGLSLASMVNISNITIKAYISHLSQVGFLKDIKWAVNEVGHALYIESLELRNSAELKSLDWLKFIDADRLTPQDGNQNIAFARGINSRSMEIIGYLRDSGGQLPRHELYKKFSELKDYKSVIRKDMKRLEGLGIVSRGEIIILQEKILNEIYSQYVKDYNNGVEELSKSGIRKRKKREQPSEDREIRYKLERLYSKYPSQKSKAV
ncbi:hypothetical protein [Leptospira interrogans]|uniref:hypothetical protein n=2 Tax=Leptospira interrogans TaxID=173 RepID=UPI00034A2A4A